ncbi:MAG: VIT1/CCC1 transporter family protein [Tepidiformaceae bacterium]
MTTPKPPSPDDIARYRRNFRDEVDGVALYERLADAEKDPSLKEVYQRLAATEVRHRDLWAEKLREAGFDVPSLKPSMRVRMLGFVARRFGTQAVAPIAARLESSAVTMYDDQPEAVAANLHMDERSHARVFREIARPQGPGGSPSTAILAIEGRHRASNGNALRAAVLGANDGLVSNLSLVMGVAGADPGRDVVLLTGVAGLLAGSLSMALGEWISVRSSAEAFERQVAIERDELALIPDEEQAELALIFQSRGVTQEQAREMAAEVMKDPERALDTLTREELGMAPEEVGNPNVAALTSFITFAVGALIPVLPWLFATGTLGIVLSAIGSGFGLFAVGAAITLFTGKGAWFSGMRMLTFGLVAAAITFLVGMLLGTSVS